MDLSIYYMDLFSFIGVRWSSVVQENNVIGFKSDSSSLSIQVMVEVQSFMTNSRFPGQKKNIP